jgi:predicted signal transduction protein with EAL and GGDEF domain
VLFIDLDEFKVFNDSLGHTAGDAFLMQIARRFSASVRGIDTISRSVVTQGTSPVANEASLARVGGDEFTILLEGISDCGDAIRVAERIQELLRIPFVIEGQEVVTTASIGIAFCAISYANSEDLVRDAEIAMYRAKREGKARYQVFDVAMHTVAVKRLRLETDLRRALELGEFRVHYQPIVALESGKIAGFEALSRWQRPEGLLLPAHFIQIAEEIGLILPMNRQLLREACLQLRAWHSQFPCDPPLTMSVNISPKEFAQPDLAAQIKTILLEVGIHPSSINVEIQETIAMADPQRSSLVLSELKALGVHISIDDFGTGYSSLSRLQGFPVDSLKIDRAFISKIDTDNETSEIVRIIIMLAHNLGLEVVAEGAETAEQVRLLTQLKCELVQGYFFARPGDHAAAQALLMNTYTLGARPSPIADI